MTDQAHADFEALIAELSEAGDADTEGQVRQSIWDRFGTSGAAFISDMADFSRTARSHGICHFLKLIHRARAVVAPIVADNKGTLLKCDADNCYAYFEHAGDAVQASFDVNAELFRSNQAREIDEHIYLSVGIDYGDLLLVGDGDFYGDPVNTASKLGEDLAVTGETLITERALNRTTISINETVERMIARISDIEISYVRIPMTQAIRHEVR